MLSMGISELLFVNSVYPWLVAFLIFPNTMHYFNLKPFTSTTLQASLKLHTPIYSIQFIVISRVWLFFVFFFVRDPSNACETVLEQ